MKNTNSNFFETVKMLSTPGKPGSGSIEYYTETLNSFRVHQTLRHASFAYEAGIAAGVSEKELAKVIIKTW